MYLILFASVVYSIIPFGMGGGRPIIVRFVLKPNDENLNKMLRRADGLTHLSASYELIVETEKTYVLGWRENEHNAVALIARDSVNGYVIQKEAPRK